jgi:hypothetical protein
MDVSFKDVVAEKSEARRVPDRSGGRKNVASYYTAIG